MRVQSHAPCLGLAPRWCEAEKLEDVEAVSIRCTRHAAGLAAVPLAVCGSQLPRAAVGAGLPGERPGEILADAGKNLSSAGQNLAAAGESLTAAGENLGMRAEAPSFLPAGGGDEVSGVIA